MKKRYIHITIKEFLELGGTLVKGLKIYDWDANGFNHIGNYLVYDDQEPQYYAYNALGETVKLGTIAHYVKVEVKPIIRTIKDEVDPKYVTTIDATPDMEGMVTGFWDNKSKEFRQVVLEKYALNPIPEDFDYTKNYNELPEESQTWLKNSLTVDVVTGRGVFHI